MGFRNTAFATVWTVEPKERSTKVRISVSRKKQDGTYETDFSGYCSFIGNAHAKASRLRERDRIQLKEVDVSTLYDKEKNTTYTTFKVYDFDPAEQTQQPAPTHTRTPSAPAPATEVEGDDAPF